MKKLNDFIETHYQKIAFVLMLAIFLNTCGNPNKITNKRIDSLNSKIDSLSEMVVILQKTNVTHNDLKIEGLKSEKRMIQSVDRKLIDVNRQSDIEKEIQNLEK